VTDLVVRQLLPSARKVNISSWKVNDSAIFARTQLTRVEKEIMASLPASASIASTKKRKAVMTGEEDAAPSITIMQAFAKVGKEDAERTKVQQKAADENEESAEEDAQEVQENPFDDDTEGVEDDTAASPPISTPADRSPASTRPIEIDTDEEMEDT